MLAMGVIALHPPAAARAEVPVPPLRGRVTDTAELLGAAEERALEGRLAALEDETGHQVVVLTVPTLEGEPIESFSMRVAEDWAIGHEGLDNGAIVVVAAGDRRARIEVGYGLEGVVPDAVAARILREQMIPRFREGRMAEGIAAGVDALAAAARGEEIPPERRPSRRAAEPDASPLTGALFCAFVGGFAGAALGRGRRLRGAVVGAGVGGGVAWWLLASGGLALVAAALGALFAAGGPGVGPFVGRPGRIPGGFGGRGGGGFRGGGGGFGGGGASGSW